MSPRPPRPLIAALPLLVLAAIPAIAANPVRLTIKDHHFHPEHVTVPAGQRVPIEVTNNDATPEEFESNDLRFEKVVVPGATIRVFVGPLQPGTYKFFGDYHPDQAKGILTAEGGK
jgi:heme/copper-type cytochrome/quinol oxidase subunit 2